MSRVRKYRSAGMSIRHLVIRYGISGPNSCPNPVKSAPRNLYDS